MVSLMVPRFDQRRGGKEQFFKPPSCRTRFLFLRNRWETPENTAFVNYMGVSINGGSLKWMVYNGKSIKIDDLEIPIISGNHH